MPRDLLWLHANRECCGWDFGVVSPVQCPAPWRWMRQSRASAWFGCDGGDGFRFSGVKDVQRSHDRLRQPCVGVNGEDEGEEGSA